MKTIEEIAQEAAAKLLGVSTDKVEHSELWLEQVKAVYDVCAAAVRREALEAAAEICDCARSEPTPYQGEMEYRVAEKAYEVAQECAAAIRSLQSPPSP